MFNIKQAMILGAGLGTRMRELVSDIPKPMLLVNGKSLIERHLIYLFKHNIKRIIINTYYKAEIFENFIRSLSIFSKLDIHFSREDELLGTAGGVKNALPLLGEEPFYVINSDAIFVDDDSTNPSLLQMQKSWQPDIMNILLLLVKKEEAYGYKGKGDFDTNSLNLLNQSNDVREFVYPGMSLMDYRVFKNNSEKILQFPEIYKSLVNQQKIYGCLYKGSWYHIGDNETYINSINLKL